MPLVQVYNFQLQTGTGYSSSHDDQVNLGVKHPTETRKKIESSVINGTGCMYKRIYGAFPLARGFSRVGHTVPTRT